MQNAVQSLEDIADRMFAALQEDEFVLYFQPIVSCAPRSDGRPLNEIFVRLQDEDDQLLPPGRFFPLLEEVGLLPYLDRWVVNRLARHVQAGLRIDENWNVPRYIVNLSNETLADRDFGNYVLQYADRSYLSDGVLGFDVPRESAAANHESLQNLMGQLRPYGCSLTVADIDRDEDLSDEIRALDPEFVKLNAISVDLARVNEITRKCREMRVQTIAEHVEDTEILDHLRRCKIDFAQGFGLAKVAPL